MRTIPVKPLTAEAFAPYGEFHDMLAPDSRRFVVGQAPITFWPDLCSAIVGGENICYSTCIVSPRPLVVDVTEYHTYCSEGMLALEQDMIIHVAPASPGNEPPLSRFEAFLVPRGTMVTIRPGVWHHAPYVLTDKPGAMLICLPPRTYQNDCTVVEIAPEQQLEIERP